MLVHVLIGELKQNDPTYCTIPDLPTTGNKTGKAWAVINIYSFTKYSYNINYIQFLLTVTPQTSEILYSFITNPLLENKTGKSLALLFGLDGIRVVTLYVLRLFKKFKVPCNLRFKRHVIWDTFCQLINKCKETITAIQNDYLCNIWQRPKIGKKCSLHPKYWL